MSSCGCAGLGIYRRGFRGGYLEEIFSVTAVKAMRIEETPGGTKKVLAIKISEIPKHEENEFKLLSELTKKKLEHERVESLGGGAYLNSTDEKKENIYILMRKGVPFIF